MQEAHRVSETDSCPDCRVGRGSFLLLARMFTTLSSAYVGLSPDSSASQVSAWPGQRSAARTRQEQELCVDECLQVRRALRWQHGYAQVLAAVRGRVLLPQLALEPAPWGLSRSSSRRAARQVRHAGPASQAACALPEARSQPAGGGRLTGCRAARSAPERLLGEAAPLALRPALHCLPCSSAERHRLTPLPLSYLGVTRSAFPVCELLPSWRGCKAVACALLGDVPS